jgi:prolyl 4-hydroxylase
LLDDPKQAFFRHYDGCYPRTSREMSLLTIIIYLSDGIEGGETTFFMDNGEFSVKPITGTALLFFHGYHHLSPEHEGSMCKKGKKYVLRSDVMFEKQKQ